MRSPFLTFLLALGLQAIFTLTCFVCGIPMFAISSKGYKQFFTPPEGSPFYTGFTGHIGVAGFQLGLENPLVTAGVLIAGILLAILAFRLALMLLGFLLRGLGSLLTAPFRWLQRADNKGSNTPDHSPLPTVKDFDIKFDIPQLQGKFYKHAKDFGISGNWNKINAEKFQNSMKDVIKKPTTQVIEGMYRKTIPVKYYFDPQTNLAIVTDMNNNYISGWRFSEDQIFNLIFRGNVQ